MVREPGGAGHPGDARALFDKAIGIYDQLEATRDLSRAAARLRALAGAGARARCPSAPRWRERR